MSDTEPVEDLRIQVKALLEENRRLRDQQLCNTIANREYRERIDDAADTKTRERVRYYAGLALRDLVEPIKALAEQAKQHDATRAAAVRLLSALEAEVPAEHPRRVLADMESSYQRLLAEKTALWNTLDRHGLLHDVEVRHV